MYPGQQDVVIGGAMFYYRDRMPTPKKSCQLTRTPSPEIKRKKIAKKNNPEIVVNYRHLRPNLANTTAKELKQRKEELRASLPKLTRREIRRHRIPYYEALCLELEEDGFPDSARYFLQLFSLNDQIREAGGVGTVVWHRPQLKHNTLHLDRLHTGLVLAETARKLGNFGEECNALLNTAVFFTRKSNIWWWVAEQLFIHSLNVGSKYRGDGGRREATARYVYGKFLQEQLIDFDEAKQHLLIARDLSTGKDWTLDKDLDPSQDTIYQESCNLLYQTFLKIGIQTRSKDPLLSVRLCLQALRRALETNRIEAQAEVLLELGISYQASGQYNLALDTLNQYLTLSQQLNYVQGRCHAYLEMAICYKALGDSEKTLEYLEIFLEVAESNQLLELTAIAHRYLGECNLNAGAPQEASQHLIKAFSLYFQLGIIQEREQTRALAAIAAGLEVVPGLIDLILDCDENNQDNFSRLIQWKDNHVPFWEAPSNMDNSSLALHSPTSESLELRQSSSSKNYFGQDSTQTIEEPKEDNYEAESEVEIGIINSELN